MAAMLEGAAQSQNEKRRVGQLGVDLQEGRVWVWLGHSDFKHRVSAEESNMGDTLDAAAKAAKRTKGARMRWKILLSVGRWKLLIGRCPQCGWPKLAIVDGMVMKEWPHIR